MTSTFEEIVSHLVYKEPVKDTANPLIQSSLYQSNEVTTATIPKQRRYIKGDKSSDTSIWKNLSLEVMDKWLEELKD